MKKAKKKERIVYRGYAARMISTGKLSRNGDGTVDTWKGYRDCEKWECRPGIEVPARVRVIVEEL